MFGKMLPFTSCHLPGNKILWLQKLRKFTFRKTRFNPPGIENVHSGRKLTLRYVRRTHFMGNATTDIPLQEEFQLKDTEFQKRTFKLLL
jgi:hypothetical protein